jgi:hypothetical protein
MTSIESLNELISKYLCGTTKRYLDEGEYSSISDMIYSTDRAFTSLEEYIKHELIIKIAYSWNDHSSELGSWHYDIGSWRYDPMFRSMYNTITQNPVLISHMIDVIKSERRGDGLEELTEYSPVDVMRHYAYYHAFSLGEDFFSEIIGEFFNRDPEDDDDIPNNRRRPYDDTSDDESDDDDIPELNDTPTRIPPPV